ncbi:MAG: polyphosphate kinase 1 [Bacteroidetes bacterium]|nr:MAG: polyphosphate kinase 1 [Bacteroidota bacterium]
MRISLQNYNFTALPGFFPQSFDPAKFRTFGTRRTANMSKYTYHNRDISWLSFNFRVLQEAMDKTLPLYERIKFLAIYSNNMEEFYQVRVSYYKQMLRHQKKFPSKHLKEVDPTGIMKQINEIVTNQLSIFHMIYEDEILPALRKNNIIVVSEKDQLNEEQLSYIRDVFYSTILTSIQPILLVKKKVRPFIKTGQPYIAMEMVNRDARYKSKRVRYGIVKIPTDHNIARFIGLPGKDGKHFIMFVEDIIMRHIDAIFPGYDIPNWYSIKMTRDADMEYDDYEGDDLIEAIDNIRALRSVGYPNRFQFDRSMPARMLDYLESSFSVNKSIQVMGGNRHNFSDFFNFPNPLYPKLEIEKLPPIPIPALTNQKRTIASLVSKKDYLLSVPYQPFEHYTRFLREAATDPTVTEIKTTQYRVSDHSVVVNSLIDAAENGKKVTVFVELKARFDEEANLKWAQTMTKAGIRIIFSIPNLKVHAKIALVIREKGAKFGDQAYLGTGNFNEKTARLYGDHGLFTANPEVVKEVKSLYRHLEDQNVRPKFKHILVPKFNMVEQFTELIDQEIKHVRKGQIGYILLKMNGLQDKEMVNSLYRASEAGVKIDLIIRGVCTLKTGQPFSKNIRVIRIVDRFLEHARVFVFLNGGEQKIYMGSADWMKRNLRRRVECVFPVYDKDARKELLDILQIQLQDNVKACLIDEHLKNDRIVTRGPDIRSQIATYEYFKRKYSPPPKNAG